MGGRDGMTGKSSYDFQAAKAEYRAFCDAGKHDIQLFALPWYLDAVCDSPDDWQVILVKSGAHIIAAFPFVYKKLRLGLMEIGHPWMTPRLGIWIDYRNSESPSARYSLEDKIVAFIIENLPPFDRFSIQFDSRFQNWQRFYEAGFQQTTHYSYVLRHAQLCPDKLLASFSTNKRRSINKSLRENVSVSELSAAEFWDFWEAAYRARNMEISFSKEQYDRLALALTSHNSCRIICARDAAGRIICILFVLHNVSRCYEIYTAYMPDRKPDSRPLLTYDAMQFAWKNNLDYDFEGSMLPGVSRYNMDFNATKEPYYYITKYSPRMRLCMAIREIARLLGHAKQALFGGTRNAA